MPTPVPASLAPGGRFAQWRPAAIRYIALDVDGTLVGSEHDVRGDAVACLATLLGSGLAVGYATGRMQSALDEIDRRITLPGPHVVHNGALVRHRGATAASWPLSDGDVATLLAIAEQFDAYGELYLDDGFLVTRDEPRAQLHWDLLGEPPRGMADTLAGRPVTKATFIAFDESEHATLVAAIEEAGMAAGAAGSPLTPDWSYINATAGGVDKGAALATAAELACTSLEHTMVVGDGSNDLPMLLVAGTAVAMGQASEAVKAAAHLVTGAVDDGGLAQALRALVPTAFG